jgi:hypothetical protein
LEGRGLIRQSILRIAETPTRINEIEHQGSSTQDGS